MSDPFSDRVYGKDRLHRLTAEADMDRAAREGGFKSVVGRLRERWRSRRERKIERLLAAGNASHDDVRLRPTDYRGGGGL